MPDLTPPTEQPLPEQARARIRGELLAHANEHRSTSPRWLVPAGAAAAVALVAATGYWAINAGGAEPQSVPVAGGGSSSAASSAPNQDPSTVPTAPSEPIQVATHPCPVEMRNVLPGASLAFEFPGGGEDGTTSFFVKGDRFALCDVRAGTTTVQQPMPLTPKGDATTYAVSSLYTGEGDQVVRVAGGVVPAGADDFDAAYTFPDGHVEHATTADDGAGHLWWRMVYAYDNGGGNELDKTPIKVTVTTSGQQHTFTLGWGIMTCAQANHGC